ncbi:hypothetical protein Tco_1517175 [Tanacetum coccineum]
MRNGEDSLFWDNLWLVEEVLKVQYPRLYALELCKDISVAEKMRHSSLFEFSLFARPPGKKQQSKSCNRPSIITSSSYARILWMYSPIYMQNVGCLAFGRLRVEFYGNLVQELLSRIHFLPQGSIDLVPPQNGACHPHGVLPTERLMVRQNTFLQVGYMKHIVNSAKLLRRLTLVSNGSNLFQHLERSNIYRV